MAWRMPAQPESPPSVRIAQFVERVGRATSSAVSEFGYAAVLLGESLFWMFAGRRLGQPVRFAIANCRDLARAGGKHIDPCCHRGLVDQAAGFAKIDVGTVAQREYGEAQIGQPRCLIAHQGIVEF